MQLVGLPLLALAAVSNAVDINWQKVGQCGVPSKRPNSNLFEGIDARSASASSGVANNGDGRSAMAQQAGATVNGNQINTDLTRVVGGQEANPHSWPWQAHLSVCGKWYGMLECNICGGSLIHPHWIVSAAHCVPSSASGTIILGAHAISYGGKQRVPVIKFVVHPSWNAPAMFDHDIAILELAQNAIITAEVSPICLPAATTCFEKSSACVVTGWGLTDERGGFPDKLQEVAVRIMEKEKCKTFKGYENVSPRMVCAGYEGGKKDACAGDSGGPLVCRINGGAWVLYGVVSWGYGCARPGSPGVYAKVNVLLDFINTITGISPDTNLGMDKCDLQDDKYDAEWKDNNNALFATLTPAWLANQPATVATAAPSPMCNYEKSSNGLSAITTGAGKIVSENYPKPYPNDQKCSWSLKNEDPELYIEVSVNKVDLHCNDRLKVAPKGSRSFSLCRVRRPLKFTDPTSIEISFTSDPIQTRKGFTLSYVFKSAFFMCKGSDTLSVDRRGVKIQTENYPRLYSASSQCRWHVTGSTGKGVSFYLRLFRTERSSTCDRNNDNLVIFDAPNCDTETLQTAPIWGSLCGYKRRGHYFTNLKSACFAFIADGDSKRNRGFQLQIYEK